MEKVHAFRELGPVHTVGERSIPPGGYLIYQGQATSMTTKNFSEKTGKIAATFHEQLRERAKPRCNDFLVEFLDNAPQSVIPIRWTRRPRPFPRLPASVASLP